MNLTYSRPSQNAGAPPKNLILGAFGGYEFASAKPFLKSLAEVGFSGDVCLFAQDISTSTRDELERWGVLVVESDDPEIKRQIITMGRFIAYQSILETIGARYQNVMLTDVRDVVFQRDPFDFEMGDSVCMFLEDTRMTIGECKFNRHFIWFLYGDEALREMSDRHISCSGTTLGSLRAVRDYVDCVVEKIRSMGERIEGYLGDQGIHNYILYKGLVRGIRVFDNQNGPVLTLGYVPESKLLFDQEGRLLNRDGSVVHVVHQFDRHPKLAEQVARRYG